MGHGGSNAVGELRTLWRRWTRIVGLFARRQRARRFVDPQKYDALHKDLVDACSSLAGMVDETDRMYLQGLEQLVLPWVSTQSFRQADRDILADLFNRCRQVDRDLGGRLLSMPDWRSAAPPGPDCSGRCRPRGGDLVGCRPLLSHADAQPYHARLALVVDHALTLRTGLAHPWSGDRHGFQLHGVAYGATVNTAWLEASNLSSRPTENPDAAEMSAETATGCRHGGTGDCAARLRHARAGSD